jgi:serine/threonine protein phosphatase PrpC
VTPGDTPRTTKLLLGRDHEEYGRITIAPVSAHTVAALSAGADVAFAATTQKHHPNEDGLLVLEDARHTVICVADAHFGRESSERLLERLAVELAHVPENPERLDAVLTRLARSRSDDQYDSETTLTICILDRLFRQAFGVSYGDSSVVHASAGEMPQRENRQTSGFVTLARPASLDPARAEHFAFSPASGDLILAFTDGVDECCYRDPDRSISPEVLHDLLTRTGDDPEVVIRELTQLALQGVAGNPGGQDNVALVVTRV